MSGKHLCNTLSSYRVHDHGYVDLDREGPRFGAATAGDVALQRSSHIPV